MTLYTRSQNTSECQICYLCLFLAIPILPRKWLVFLLPKRCRFSISVGLLWIETLYFITVRGCFFKLSCVSLLMVAKWIIYIVYRSYRRNIHLQKEALCAEHCQASYCAVVSDLHGYTVVPLSPRHVLSTNQGANHLFNHFRKQKSLTFL